MPSQADLQDASASIDHQLHSADLFYDVEQSCWLATRYQDVKMILTDPRFSATLSTPQTDFVSEPKWYEALKIKLRGKRVPRTNNAEPFHAVKSWWLMNLDPPEHTQLRALVSKALTAQRIASLRPDLERTAEQLLNQVQDKGTFDLIAHYALPLPIHTVCTLIGIPTADFGLFEKWLPKWLAIFYPGSVPDAETNASLNAQGRAMIDYFETLVRARQSKPDDDLSSALLSARNSYDKISEIALVSTLIFIAIAGYQTSRDLISAGMYYLLLNPQAYANVRANGLNETALNELLRFVSPAQFVARRASVDVNVGGKTIRRGEIVRAVLAAANRDPELFSEPERLELTRPNNPHLAFGYGAHYCIGAGLGKLEASVAINTLVRRMPHLELSARELPWSHGGSRAPLAMWVKHF